MCIPPIHNDPKVFFEKMYELSKELKLEEFSMGISADYIEAVKNYSTILRIGSKIFGPRN